MKLVKLNPQKPITFPSLEPSSTDEIDAGTSVPKAGLIKTMKRASVRRLRSISSFTSHVIHPTPSPSSSPESRRRRVSVSSLNRFRRTPSHSSVTHSASPAGYNAERSTPPLAPTRDDEEEGRSDPSLAIDSGSSSTPSISSACRRRDSEELAERPDTTEGVPQSEAAEGSANCASFTRSTSPAESDAEYSTPPLSPTRDDEEEGRSSPSLATDSYSSSSSSIPLECMSGSDERAERQNITDGVPEPEFAEDPVPNPAPDLVYPFAGIYVRQCSEPQDSSACGHGFENRAEGLHTMEGVAEIGTECRDADGEKQGQLVPSASVVAHWTPRMQADIPHDEAIDEGHVMKRYHYSLEALHIPNIFIPVFSLHRPISFHLTWWLWNDILTASRFEGLVK